jgi:mannose-6-phosphate isomerase-like protein (cupin superfamily)
MPFIETGSIVAKELLPGWTARFFHSDHMTFSYTEVDAGVAVHAHHHPEEEVWHVVAGEVEFTLGDETRQIGAGEAVAIPSGLLHSARAVTAFRAIVVDFPLRMMVAGVSTR